MVHCFLRILPFLVDQKDTVAEVKLVKIVVLQLLCAHPVVVQARSIALADLAEFLWSIGRHHKNPVFLREHSHHLCRSEVLQFEMVSVLEGPGVEATISI